MMKKSIVFSSLLAMLLSVVSLEAKPNAKKGSFPYGNPVITHMYTADASPHVMPDGKVWMITSVDDSKGGGYSTMHSYHIFSSSDMLNWKDHGEVLHLDDVIKKEPANENWALWAPDMIYHNGLYYLYFPVNVRPRDGGKATSTWTGVAVAKNLGDKFEVIQLKIPGTRGIDPSVFKDDDGRIYLYYGPRNMAEINSDTMIEFTSEIKKIDVDVNAVLDTPEFKAQWVGKSKSKRFKAPNYMEAPWMHKHNGKYFFNYHTQYGSDVKGHEQDPTRRKSHLDYSYGTNPWGPLEYGGVLNYELGEGVKDGPRNPGYKYVPWRINQSNHGGVVEFHGKDYLFYHTSALSAWNKDRFKSGGSWTKRSVCVDEIPYDENDMPMPVKQTLSGPEPVKVNQPFDVVLGKSVAFNDGVAEIKGVDFGTGYYYFDTTIADEGVEGRLEIRIGAVDGMLVGTVVVTPTSLAQRGGLVDTAVRDAKGKQNVYLVWKGNKPLTKIANPRIFAGSPQK